MDLKAVWEKYAEQAAGLANGVRPYPSDTAILCALHLEIADQLFTIAELAATPSGEPPLPHGIG